MICGYSIEYTLNEHHDTSGLLEFGDQFAKRMSSNDALALGLVSQEVIHFGSSPVEGTYDETVIRHIQDQVLTHDGQTDQSNISPIII